MSDVSGLLDGLTSHAAWRLQAACGVDRDRADLFFGSDRESIAAALAVCEECPVTAECLAEAKETKSRGVWGGTTEVARMLEHRGITHCKNGHRMTEETTRLNIGNRGVSLVCRVCDRAYQREQKRAARVRKAAARAAGAWPSD